MRALMAFLRPAAIVLAGACAGYPLKSFAVPVLETAPCTNDAGLPCAFGITGLEVGGRTFDVDFAFTSYNDTFASSSPTFLGDVAGGSEAAFAIRDLLNLAVVGVVRNTDPFSEIIQIPRSVSSDGLFVTSTCVRNDGGAPAGSVQARFWEAGGLCSISAGVAAFPYAVFTETFTPVPEPASGALIIAGLLGLRLASRFRARVRSR